MTKPTHVQGMVTRAVLRLQITQLAAELAVVRYTHHASRRKAVYGALYRAKQKLRRLSE